MRVPGWCRKYTIAVNGKQTASPFVENGYVKIGRKWESGDKIRLNFEMPVEVVAADPQVKQNIGKRAVQRGPLVYCAEQADNRKIDWNQISIDPDGQFKPVAAKRKLEGMTILQTNNQKRKLTFIPYFAWDNREPGKMKVWLDYHEK